MAVTESDRHPKVWKCLQHLNDVTKNEIIMSKCRWYVADINKAIIALINRGQVKM